MAIKGRVGLGVTDIIAGDTSVLIPADPNSRVAVVAFSLYNTTGANVTVDLFESPDTTSAAGKQIATYDIAADSSELVVECIGQGYELNENIIAVGSAVGVNARITQTEYTGSS